MLLVRTFFILFILSVYAQDYPQQLLSFPNPAILREHLQNITSLPHCLGWNENNSWFVASYIRDAFEQYGLQNARITNHTVDVTLPIHRSLEVYDGATLLRNFTLIETPIPEDPTSNDTNVLPTFLGFAGNGTVDGQYVYVNYGTREDYEHLRTNNIDVSGKIVLARYGNSFRGIKLYEAQMRGAIGVIIYSDPYDDGYRIDDTYPIGPMRPPQGVQRGSSKYEFFCPGPLSNERVELCNTTNPKVSSIPAIPISYEDAQYLLDLLRSTKTPVDPSWQGALDFHYHYGPSNNSITLNLSLTSFNKSVTLHNVEGYLYGNEEVDKIIMMGNHHDAWVFGAVDPGSGTTVLLETVRTLTSLRANQWSPRRTIRFHAWDGEEWGIFGSILYGETNSKEITSDVVAYLNVDVAVSGPNPSFNIGSTGSMTNILVSDNVLGRLNDSSTGRPLKETWNKQVSQLGAGSDFLVFVNRLGIPSMDSSLDGNYGVYHSIFDSFHWMDSVGDPGFGNHKVMTQFYSLALYYLSSEAVIPLDHIPLYENLQSNLLQVQRAAGVLLSYVNISNAINNFKFAADVANQKSKDNLANPSLEEIKAFNNMLVNVEKEFLLPNGLPERPWYKNSIAAVGIHKGYGAVPFPSVWDSLDIDNPDYNAIQAKLDQVAGLIQKAADKLKGDTPYPSPPKDFTTMIALYSFVGISTVIIILYFVVNHLRGSHVN